MVERLIRGIANLGVLVAFTMALPGAPRFAVFETWDSGLKGKLIGRGDRI